MRGCCVERVLRRDVWLATCSACAHIASKRSSAATHVASGAVKPFLVSRDSHEARPLGSACCSHACHCGSSSASGFTLSGDSSGDGRPALMVVRLRTLKSLGSFAFADASIAVQVGHASSAVIVSSAVDPGATREMASLTASGKPGKSPGPSSVIACDAVSYRRCHSAPSPLLSPAMMNSNEFVFRPPRLRVQTRSLPAEGSSALSSSTSLRATSSAGPGASEGATCR